MDWLVIAEEFMKKMVAREKMTLLALLTGVGYSSTKVRQLLRHRAILVGSVAATRPDHPLEPGDEVLVRSAKEVSEGPGSGSDLEIVYEDEAVIVIDKPAGLLTIATEKEKVKTAYYRLNDYLRQRRVPAGGRAFIVHRLDRDTSGLLVFARNEATKRRLQQDWKEVDKRYAAIVEGVPEKTSGQITSHLRESKSLRVYSARGSRAAGEYSVTSYQVVKAAGSYALLDIQLVTGRKNQIRVHLADLGHPVTGDKKYGARTNPLGRLALHAYFLAFAHPVSGKRLEFQSRLPGKFNSLMAKASKTAAAAR